MGSLPTFDPNIFTKPLSQSVYTQLNNAQQRLSAVQPRDPELRIPTGSTFKGITATAALQSGAWTLGQSYDDTGVYSNGAGDVRHNAGHAAYGVLDLTQAIQVSSDNFFYNLGRLMNSRPAQRRRAAAMGARLRDGTAPPASTSAGRTAASCPRPRWRQLRRPARDADASTSAARSASSLRDRRRPPVVGRRQREPRRRPGRPRGDAAAAGASPTRRSRTAAPSSVPTSGSRSTPPTAPCCSSIDPAPARHVPINPVNLDAIRTGLHAAASQPGGTSADVFAGWPQNQYPVYGKTGTAQHNNQADQSWYVCFVPDPHRADRGRGDGRAGRLRRRRGRPRRAPDPVPVVLRQARASSSPGQSRTL